MIAFRPRVLIGSIAGVTCAVLACSSNEGGDTDGGALPPVVAGQAGAAGSAGTGQGGSGASPAGSPGIAGSVIQFAGAAGQAVAGTGGSGPSGVGTTVTKDCASTKAESTDTTTVQPADIIVAIDSSGSMDVEIEFVRTQMNQFSQQIIASGVDARVILIAERQAICIGAPLGSGQCPMDDNPPNFVHVDEEVGSNDALNVIVDTFDQWRMHLRPDASKSFLVITDDDATDRPNNSAAAFSAALTQLDPMLFAKWTFNGVYCFTECVDAMGEELAADVGNVYIDLVAQTQGVGGDLCLQDFQPVFTRLAEKIVQTSGSKIACEWEFPMPPAGQSFSPDLVEVRRSNAAGTTSLVRVANDTECAASQTGWFYDNAMSPTRILACPGTCEALQMDKGGKIDVIFGCELVEGCAASGSATVDNSQAGANLCEFALPMPPAGQALDTANVNVRFRSATGVATTLGNVPIAADCALAGGGWHYNDAKNPTTIQMCPETCSLIEAAGMGAKVDVLFGCRTKEQPIPR